LEEKLKEVLAALRESRVYSRRNIFADDVCAVGSLMKEKNKQTEKKEAGKRSMTKQSGAPYACPRKRQLIIKKGEG